jgi:type I restriction enzyme, S subunit
MNEWKETEIGLMPTNWQEYTIDDLIENIIDNRGKTPPPATNGYKLLETYQVSVDKIFPMYDDTQQKYVSEATYKTWFRSGHPQQDDILFTTVGERVPQFCLVDKTLICIAQNLIALRVNKKIVNPLYLLNYFRQEKFIKQVKNILLTTAQPSVKVPHLLALRIYLPSTDYQDKISQLLSCLDNKIDNLRRQNETLEKIAQTLFKHWFIDFEFPNDDGKPYKSSGGAMVASELGDIPAGWRVGKLEELIIVNPRESIKTGAIVKYVDMRALSTSSMEITDYVTREFTSGSKFKNQDTLLARITPCLENGKTAFVSILDDGEVAFGSTEFIVLRAKENCCPEYIYPLARSPYFRDFAVKNMTGSSGRQRIPNDVIANYKLAIPDIQTIKNYQKICRPLFLKTSSNQKQIQILTKTRDALLPKLMSGELRVKDSITL